MYKWIPSSLNKDMMECSPMAKLWLTIHLGGILSILHHPVYILLTYHQFPLEGKDLYLSEARQALQGAAGPPRSCK